MQLTCLTHGLVQAWVEEDCAYCPACGLDLAHRSTSPELWEPKPLTVTVCDMRTYTEQRDFWMLAEAWVSQLICSKALRGEKP